MELEGYPLVARSPFHVGQPGIGQESVVSFVHSDTLFGALCSGIYALYSPAVVEAWLQLFLEARPPCLFSSAFPYYKGIRFFPRPELPDLDPADLEQARRYRKLKFVSESIYRRLLNGERPKLRDGKILHQEHPDYTAWVTGEEALEIYRGLLNGEDSKLRFSDPPTQEEIDQLTLTLWQPVQHPHVAVDRLTNRSALYYVRRLVFQAGGGLHFLVRWLDPAREVQPGLSVKKLMEQSLSYLSESGLGGDRSRGFGQFVFPNQSDKLSFEESATTQYWSSLSLYHPQQTEWEQLQARWQAKGEETTRTAYELVQRVGWITLPELSTYQRRPVWMLAEGACLHFNTASDTPGLGDLVEVSPDLANVPTKIWRYGRALVLPIKPSQ